MFLLLLQQSLHVSAGEALSNKGHPRAHESLLFKLLLQAQYHKIMWGCVVMLLFEGALYHCSEADITLHLGGYPDTGVKCRSGNSHDSYPLHLL